MLFCEPTQELSLIKDTSEQDRVISQHHIPWYKKPIRLIVVGAAIVLVVVAYPNVQKMRGTQLSVAADKVRLTTVIRSNLVRDVAVQGKIIAAVKPMLFSPAAGRVSLMVRAGDSVSQGDLIARIDSPGLMSLHQQELSTLQSLSSEVDRQEIQTRTERLELRQQLDMAEVALTAANREMRRAVIAFDKNVISLQDHEKATDDLYKAELEFRHRKDENVLRFERLDLELKIRSHELNRQQFLVDDLYRKVGELSIVSPVTGVVGNLEVNEKDAVTIYQPILSVVDLSAYEVEIDVPESFADDLSLGLDVEIQKGDETDWG